MGLKRNVYLQQDHPSFNMYFDKESEAAFLITQCYDAQCVCRLFIMVSGKRKGVLENQMDLAFKPRRVRSE